eukprot:g4059.t1 g4059   contig15:252416-253129(-)
MDTGLCINAIQMHAKRNGGLLFLTCHTIGLIYVFKASFFRVIKLHHSFTPSTGSTFDPVAHHVSAINLHQDCPATLLRALADNHPDREIWLQSYYEEKGSIESMGTFQRLTVGEYRALREKGAPKAIPTMCVLTIKKDENLMPLRAKSRIVVLGNLEDRSWSKSQRYAPVLRQDSLRYLVSLAIEQCRVLKQGDCKMPSAMAFCHLTKSPSSALHPVIPTLSLANTGFSRRHCTVSS